MPSKFPQVIVTGNLLCVQNHATMSFVMVVSASILLLLRIAAQLVGRIMVSTAADAVSFRACIFLEGGGGGGGQQTLHAIVLHRLVYQAA